MATETEIERMVIRLVGDGALYSRMMTQAASTTASVASSIQSNTSTIQNYAKSIQNYASKAGQQLSQLKSQAGQIAGMGLGAIGASNLPAMAGAAGAVGMAGGFGWAISLASQAEDAQGSFEVMLQSASGAKKMLADLSKFAADTPFEMPQLRQATQMMLQYGVTQDKIMPNLKALGDIAQGDGQKLHGLAYNFAQVKSMGRLTGGDKNSMVGWGFNPLEAIAKSANKTMPEVTAMMEKGQISFAMLEQALQHAVGPTGRYFNSMEKASKRTSGLMSTLADTIKIEVTKIGEVIIEKFKVKEMLVKLIGWAGIVGPKISEAFGKAVDWAMPKIQTAFKFMGSVITTVTPYFVSAGQMIASAGQMMSSAFSEVVKVLGYLYDYIAPLLPTITDIKNVISQVVTSVSQWIASNQELLLNIGYAIAAMIAAKLVIAGIISAIAAIGPTIATVGSAILLIFNPLTLIVALVGTLTYSFFAFTEAGKRASAALGEAFNFVAEQFGILVALVRMGEIELAWNITTTTLNLAWAETVAYIMTTWIGVKTYFAQVTNLTLNVFQLMFEGIKFAGMSTVNILIQGWNKIVPKRFEIPEFDTSGPLKSMKEIMKAHVETNKELLTMQEAEMNAANAPAEAARKAWQDAQDAGGGAIKKKEEKDAKGPGGNWLGTAMTLGSMAMDQIDTLVGPATDAATTAGQAVGSAYTAGVKSELQSLDAIEATANNAYNVMESFRAKFATPTTPGQNVAQGPGAKVEEKPLWQTMATGIVELVDQGRKKVGGVMEIGIASLSGP